jgi:molybdopterin/thiamine biosynthesis adenylyltransferase
VVIGAGGLGCPALFAMAPSLVERGMGVLVIDDDVVDLSNLHRQILHSTIDVGRPKVESARDALIRRWPELRVETKRIRIGQQNARGILRGAAVVLDGTDSIDSKFVINDACVAEGVPLVHGGVVRWEGQLMTVIPGGACYRCLFEEPPREAPPTCEQAGVLGPAAGVIGTMMADEALRALDGKPALAGTMIVCDFSSSKRRLVRIHRRRGCEACAASPLRAKEERY